MEEKNLTITLRYRAIYFAWLRNEFNTSLYVPCHRIHYRLIMQVWTWSFSLLPFVVVVVAVAVVVVVVVKNGDVNTVGTKQKQINGNIHHQHHRCCHRHRRLWNSGKRRCVRRNQLDKLSLPFLLKGDVRRSVQFLNPWLWQLCAPPFFIVCVVTKLTANMERKLLNNFCSHQSFRKRTDHFVLVLVVVFVACWILPKTAAISDKWTLLHNSLMGDTERVHLFFENISRTLVLFSSSWDMFGLIFSSNTRQARRRINSQLCLKIIIFLQ